MPNTFDHQYFWPPNQKKNQFQSDEKRRTLKGDSTAASSNHVSTKRVYFVWVFVEMGGTICLSVCLAASLCTLTDGSKALCLLLPESLSQKVHLVLYPSSLRIPPGLPFGKRYLRTRRIQPPRTWWRTGVVNLPSPSCNTTLGSKLKMDVSHLTP